MKDVPIGTCFSIPLEDEVYGFGYVVYAGLFLTVNIFDYESKKPSDIKLSFSKPLLVKDMLADWMLFKKAKHDDYPKWDLKRNVIVPEPLSPDVPSIILGNGNCLNFLTGEQHLATDLEKNEFPILTIHHKDYYSVYVRAMFNRINVSSIDFDEDRNCYVIS
ncbi:hypothetical protein [Shewanella woodyi]|uniref:hypothetical protein n=1 Tax=Shewanella woodyi TaxID=60961 RepID=UPI0007EB8387|nr:hypothetical protein [Shewanella woodyi]